MTYFLDGYNHLRFLLLKSFVGEVIRIKKLCRDGNGICFYQVYRHTWNYIFEQLYQL